MSSVALYCTHDDDSFYYCFSANHRVRFLYFNCMQVKLALFGKFALMGQGVPVKFATDHARALLAYLAVEPGTHDRSALAALLWPEQPENAARQNLRQTLLHLKQESVSEMGRGSVTANWRSFFLRRWGERGWSGRENGAKGQPTTQKLGYWVSRRAGGDRRSRRKVEKWRKNVLVGRSSRGVRRLVALGFLLFFS